MFLIWIPGEVNKNEEKDRTGTLVYHVTACRDSPSDGIIPETGLPTDSKDKIV